MIKLATCVVDSSNIRSPQTALRIETFQTLNSFFGPRIWNALAFCQTGATTRVLASRAAGSDCAGSFDSARLCPSPSKAVAVRKGEGRAEVYFDSAWRDAKLRCEIIRKADCRLWRIMAVFKMHDRA